MRFTSDYSVTRQGFQLQLTVIAGSLDYHEHVSEGETIRIQSPNFPDFYPNNAYVHWVITKDHEELYFQITILRLSLNSYDYLTGRAGDQETNATTNVFSYGPYSRIYSSVDFLLREPSVVIEFSSDAYFTDMGFELEISVLNASGMYSLFV
eukprot:XP_011663822.1 PREDICTED: cubilin-like [Strongylocentrotus purpuratus]